MSEDETGIEVTFEEAAVTIDGVAQTPTPCYTATIESAAVTDGKLQLQVGFDEDESDLCTECVGTVAYTATIEVDTTEGIDQATVTHTASGSTFTKNREHDGSNTSPSDNSQTTPVDDPESEPDPDLQVSLENEHTERHEIDVDIRRESGETVYAEEHDIRAGGERDIYNLKQASPDGVERFTISATMAGESESIRVETSLCYGEAIISVTEDGTLYPYYAIC